MNAPMNEAQLLEEDMFIYTGHTTVKAVDILNDIFRRAVAEGVADVHFRHQSRDKPCRVRFRSSDGLRYIEDIPASVMAAVDEKIRSKAQVPISERHTPLDGRMTLIVQGKRIDVRVGISPGITSEGQLISCRLLDQTNSNIRLDDIEMTTAARQSLRRVIEEPSGLFLVTGPTGSGKTTTLYSIMNELNTPENNILTAEHPVEYQIEDFHQMHVDGVKMTFAKALRAMLRQDPDIIMVGEIRDLETATIAFQAASTGHLVLSTLHTNDSASAITRLIDMGIDESTISANLRGVLAQRLLRKVAPDAEYTLEKPNSSDRKWLSAHNVHREDAHYKVLTNPAEGYKGRIPVMEIIMIDQRVKKVLGKGRDAIFEAASRQSQFETLGQAGERLAFEGITTLDKVKQISSEQDSPVIHNRRLGQMLIQQDIVSDHDIALLLKRQAQAHAEGKQEKLGDMLLEMGLCTREQIHGAIGYTLEAHDILQRICTTDDLKTELSKLVRRWTPGVQSLFKLAMEQNLATEQEIKDELAF